MWSHIGFPFPTFSSGGDFTAPSARGGLRLKTADLDGPAYDACVQALTRGGRLSEDLNHLYDVARWNFRSVLVPEHEQLRILRRVTAKPPTGGRATSGSPCKAGTRSPGHGASSCVPAATGDDGFPGGTGLWIRRFGGAAVFGVEALGFFELV
ncbi:hypothetical protein ACFVJK_48205, partial [Streptomyces sp. NPDC127172]|uniref:hypothetical protein n=1 Tax=Streptomyces sp. NPDC127172 TaxID=3345382 RepID=UPI003628C23B